jgi:hypothetical protein
MRGATVEQISDTPFERVWKSGFSKRERKLIKRALRKELKRLEPESLIGEEGDRG